jgi:hypothetical protein
VEGPVIDGMTGSLAGSYRTRDGYLERVAYPGNGTPATGDESLFPFTGYGSDDKEGQDDTYTFRGKLMWTGDRTTVRLSADYTRDKSTQGSSLIQTIAGFEPGAATYGDTVLPDLGGESAFPGYGPLLDLDSPASDLNGDGNPFDGLFFGNLYNYCLSQSGPQASSIPALAGGIFGLCGTRGQIGSELDIPTPLYGNPNGAAYYTDNFVSKDKDKTYGNGPNFSDLKSYGLSATVDYDLSDTLALKSITSTTITCSATRLETSAI